MLGKLNFFIVLYLLFYIYIIYIFFNLNFNFKIKFIDLSSLSFFNFYLVI